MSLVEDNDVIQKFSAKASDHAFNIGVLPGRGRSRDDLIDTQRINPSSNPITIFAVAVTQQILRGLIDKETLLQSAGLSTVRSDVP